MRRAALVFACGCAAGAPVRPEPAPAPARTPTLVTASFGGLAALGSDGAFARALSATPGSRPRWTRAHDALVFLSQSHEVRRLQVATGVETVIARLPATITPCAGTTIDVGKLDVWADDDFALDAPGRAVCIRLQDRNLNAMSQSVAYLVDLATGSAAQTIVESACEKIVDSEPRGCLETALPGGESARPITQPFATAEGYVEETVSPSGQWSVVGGNRVVGDSIFRDVFLLDRTATKLYPLPDEAATWPAPIEPRDLESWSGRTMRAVGETPIFWLGARLVIGHALITPGASIVQLPGDVAR